MIVFGGLCRVSRYDGLGGDSGSVGSDDCSIIIMSL